MATAPTPETTPATIEAIPDTFDQVMSFEWGVRIADPTIESPAWLDVREMTGFTPTVTPVTKERKNYDMRGAKKTSRVSEEWSLSFDIPGRIGRTSGKHQPELELLLAKDAPEAVGNKAEVLVQWAHRPLSGKASTQLAYEGTATVTLNRASTESDSDEVWSVTLTGNGKRKKITNPYTND